MKDATALIIVDVQNDFITGSLATDPDNTLAPRLAEYVRAMAPHYAKIVTTQDWHINPEGHWAKEGEEPNYSTTWPVHCKAGEEGSDIETTLASALDEITPPVEHFYKGQYLPSYSGFDGVTDKGEDLDAFLKKHFIETVDVVGIATDFCVKETIDDAVKKGYNVNVLANYTQGVNAENTAELLNNKFNHDTVNILNNEGV